jgi:hypothetical protein
MQSDPRRTDGAVQGRVLPEGDLVLGNGFDVEESGGGLAHDEVLSGDSSGACASVQGRFWLVGTEMLTVSF